MNILDYKTEYYALLQQHLKQSEEIQVMQKILQRNAERIVDMEDEIRNLIGEE
jgi:hypothetical protein